MTADLDLQGKKEQAGEGEDNKDESADTDLDPLLLHIRAVLQDKVEKVRVSKRLTDSPACLVIPEGGLQPHIERLLRAQNADMPRTKRILEVNPDHALIRSLRELHGRDASNPDVREWIEMLYEQALLAEGSPVEDPVQMAARLTRLLQKAASAAAAR
jgi:molecular chaperone HtpG